MAYSPTHDAPAGGLPTYTAPDPTKAPVAQLDPGLDVQLLERRADWAHIVCSNGWEAWVDARRLVARAVPAPQPTPPPPATPPAATAAPTTTPAPAATTETPVVSTAAATPSPPATPVPPSQEWAVPASGAPAAGSAGGGLKIGPGQIIALAGAALVLLSGWLDWIDLDIARQTFSASAYKVPAHILVDNTVDVPSAGVNLGVLVFLAAAVTVVGALVRPVRWLALVGGGLAIVLGAVFLFQISLAVGDLEDAGLDAGIFDLAGFAPILAVLGGIVAAVGGAFALAQKK